MLHAFGSVLAHRCRATEFGNFCVGFLGKLGRPGLTPVAELNPGMPREPRTTSTKTTLSASDPQSQKGGGHVSHTRVSSVDVLVPETGVCSVTLEPVVVEKTCPKRGLGRDNPSLREGSGPRLTKAGKSGSLTAGSLIGVRTETSVSAAAIPGRAAGPVSPPPTVLACTLTGAAFDFGLGRELRYLIDKPR